MDATARTVSGRSAGMSFMQVFGATVIALAVYVFLVVTITVYGCWRNDKDETLLICFVSGAVLFTCLFTVWYMGVPVPKWMK